jgi:hypothetical protein
MSDIIQRNARCTARGLGWFSIGLGLAELVAPRCLARAIGLRGKETLVAGYGMREIATGIGILASKDPAPWIWGRVAGDALDLGTLATGVDDRNPRKDGLAIAFVAVAGVAILDLVTAQALTARKSRAPAAPVRDYSDRSGFPGGLEQARGAAREDKPREGKPREEKPRNGGAQGQPSAG